MIGYDQLEGHLIILGDTEFSGPRFEAFKELAAQAKAHGSLCVGQVSQSSKPLGRKQDPEESYLCI
jgi:hypothetical protein